MARKDISKDGTNTQFGKGQDCTKGGRKKSVLNEVWKILVGDDEADRIIVMSKEDKYKFIEAMIELPVSKLQEIVNNENLPVFMLNIVVGILGDIQERKTVTIDKYFDRFYGKAQSDIKINAKVEEVENKKPNWLTNDPTDD